MPQPEHSDSSKGYQQTATKGKGDDSPNASAESNGRDKPKSGSSSVMAGMTRSVLFSFKKMGLTGAYLNFQLRKRTFMFLGQGQLESSEHLSSVTKEGATKLPKYHAKASHMVKTSVLGVAVFGIYDLVVGWWTWEREKRLADSINKPEPRTDGTKESPENGRIVLMKISVRPDDRELSVPLFVHWGAGALAGMIQSFILDAWQIGTYWFWHQELSLRSSTKLQWAKANKGINLPFVFRRCVHHSLGYASLFGIFETCRRLVVNASFDFIRSGDPAVHHALETLEKLGVLSASQLDGSYNMTILPMSAAFLAGGFAGQAQFIANHYTTNWKLLAHHDQSKRKLASMPATGSKSIWGTLPPARGLRAAYLPAALTFVAFHYGGEITERLMQDAEPEPFAVFVWSPPSFPPPSVSSS